MQIREQWKGSKNWKRVTGAATAATLSLGALGIAIPGGAGGDSPELWIFLDERASADTQTTAEESVPLDLGTATGQHADRIAHDNLLFGGPLWGLQPLAFPDRPAVRAGSDASPPVSDGAAGASSDGVADSDDADETTSADVLSDDVDATGDAIEEITDDGVTDGPAVGDDPLPDEPVSGDAAALGDDSPDDSDDSPDDSDDSPDDSVDSRDDSQNDPNDSPDDSDDSPDDSDDSPDDSDDSPDDSDDSPDDSD